MFKIPSTFLLLSFVLDQFNISLLLFFYQLFFSTLTMFEHDPMYIITQFKIL